MRELLQSILGQVSLSTVLDIAITAVLIYWLFSLIRGTQAVRLVVGVTILVLVYVLAEALGLRLLRQVLESGAVVALFALVVVFQPELRAIERVSDEVASAAAGLSRDGYGALIVIERETGLEQVAETGVMIHGDVSADLLRTIFARGTSLHDGAVIIREDRVLAAGALLPLAETTIHTERYGTRHRAALGITESTDAIVVVVSEENGQISLVERARIVRNLNEPQLSRAIRALLDPTAARRRQLGGRGSGPGGRAPRLGELGRFVGRGSSAGRSAEEDSAAAAAAQVQR